MPSPLSPPRRWFEGAVGAGAGLVGSLLSWREGEGTLTPLVAGGLVVTALLFSRRPRLLQGEDWLVGMLITGAGVGAGVQGEEALGGVWHTGG